MFFLPPLSSPLMFLYSGYDSVPQNGVVFSSLDQPWLPAMNMKELGGPFSSFHSCFVFLVTHIRKYFNYFLFIESYRSDAI